MPVWTDSDKISNLALDFTQKCNLSCSYCYLYSKQDVSKEELPVSDLINTVKKTLKIFPGITDVECWGGEPLYDADRLMTFCAAMKEIGIKTWAPSTNGTLLGQEKNHAAWKFCNGDKGGQVSFDGNKKYHDKNRNNSFNVVVKNLKKCIDIGDSISLRLTYEFDEFLDAIQENLIALPKLYKEFSQSCTNQQGVDRLFAVYPYQGKKLLMLYGELDTIFTHSEIIKRAPIYRNYYEQLDKIMDNFLNEEVIFLPPYISDTIQTLISNEESISVKGCGSFFSQIFLHPISGDIYPCLSQDTSQYRSIAKLMNVNNGEVNWPAVNTIKNFMFRRNRKCFDCKLQSSCFGPCYHQSVNPPGESSAFNMFWNTNNIPKCTFSYSIFDIVVSTSEKIIDHINKTS